MRGSKGTPYQGGTRAPSFWRWPAGFKGGRDVAALTAHIDIFPTLAEIVGAPLSPELQKQVEGRSLLPLLKDPDADWPDRFLVTHVGRWECGQRRRGEVHRTARSATAASRWSTTRSSTTCQTDPGETTNVIDEHPDVVAALRAAYDQWWQDVQPTAGQRGRRRPQDQPLQGPLLETVRRRPRRSPLEANEPDAEAVKNSKRAAAPPPPRKKPANTLPFQRASP